MLKKKKCPLDLEGLFEKIDPGISRVNLKIGPWI